MTGKTVGVCRNCGCSFEYTDDGSGVPEYYCPICFAARMVARRVARAWQWVRNVAYDARHPGEALG